MYSRCYTIALVALAATISLIEATPFSKRSIDDATFSELQLFSQYAAASYCTDDSNTQPGQLGSCPHYNDYPLLTSGNQQPIETVWTFQHSLWTDVTGFIALDPNRNLTILAFRGSHSLKNWLANLDAGLTMTDICPNCRAWHGFWLSWQEARQGIMDTFQRMATQRPHYRAVVVGHSLGGAIADLAAADFRNGGMPADLFTYGAPRIGDSVISDYITNAPPQNGSTYRITHTDDPVPKVPPQGWGFSDIGPEYWISSKSGVNVTINDITKYAGDDMKTQGDHGDLGVFSVFRLDVAAHLWYFGPMESGNKKQVQDARR